jgi:hypothetical protein
MYSDPLSWQHGLIGTFLLAASIAVYGYHLLATQIAKFRNRRHR